MLTTKNCAFCGRNLASGYGVMFVRNDGTVTRYCSSKCRKNALKLRRDSRKLKWTTHHKEK